MRGSIRIAKVAGIEIGIHYTWLFIFALVTWFLAANFFPQSSPGYSRLVYWGLGAVSALLFFISVLLHELAHSLYARSRGVPVSSIVLFLFGGVSNLGEESPRAREEFWMALLGPLASLVLAGIFWGSRQLVADGASPLASTLYNLAIMNAGLGAFNLLPGFPLDGGRIFRATVWGLTGERDAATRLAAILGHVIAWGLIFGGVFLLFYGVIFQGIWLALIGMFLNFAANASRREISMERHIRGVSVTVVMDAAPPTVTPQTAVEVVVREFFIRQGRRAVPVVDGDAVVGMVTLSDVKGLPPEARFDAPVSGIMTRPPFYSVSPEDDLLAAMKLIDEHHVNQLLVLRQGRLAGMVRRADILRYLTMRQELRLPADRRPG